MSANSVAKKTIEDFFDAVNRRDWEAFSALVADDFEWTEPMMGERVGMGRENFLRDAKSFVDNIP
jgi:ketosteroid isomerase-like protein